MISLPTTTEPHSEGHMPLAGHLRELRSCLTKAVAAVGNSPCPSASAFSRRNWCVPPRVWAERAYSDLVYFKDHIAADGHFAAFEQPVLFAKKVRAFARTLCLTWARTAPAT